MSSSCDTKPAHLVFFPCPGMGHLTPFLRLASMAASHNYLVTLVNTQPSPCAEEAARISSFFYHHPEINCLEFKINHSNCSKSTLHNTFLSQLEAITCSIGLLPPLLCSLPQPVSAIFYDFAVAASFTQLMSELGIPSYIVSTTSARCYALVAYLPALITEEAAADGTGDVKIPGVAPLRKSLIPEAWLDDDSVSNHLLRKYFMPNVQSLPRVKGVLLNSFDGFEKETVAALINGRVLSDLPPVIPVGPLQPHKLEKGIDLPWLDHQSAASVMFVSFGRRINMSVDQIRELGHGLMSSGLPFLWVLGADRTCEDEQEELRELLGESLVDAVKMKGIVMKRWVDQVGILAHPSIGGFLNQCEWGSVMDAARFGVPVLGWPQLGDQKISAEVVANAGLGMWKNEWGWGGERMVKRDEIGKGVRELMEDKKLRVMAWKVGEEARKSSGNQWMLSLHT